MQFFPGTSTVRPTGRRMASKPSALNGGQIAQRIEGVQASKAAAQQFRRNLNNFDVRVTTVGRSGAGPLTRIRVHRQPNRRFGARLVAGSLSLPCVLGPAGIVAAKREGDGATPRGRFEILGAFFRPDRGPRPALRLAVHPLRASDGWCDDPAHAAYNRPVALPVRAGHERMWRDDGLYDLGLVIDYNVSHPRKRQGSAIFVHIASPEGRPTAGCVALKPADLRRLLPRLARRCTLTIG